MPRLPHISIGLALLAALAAAPVRADEAPATVREGIERGVRANFAGRWDDADAAWAALRSRWPDHPAGHAFQMTTDFWRISLDLGDPRLDDRIRRSGERAIELAQARVARDEADAEGLFYWGQALGYLARLLAERGDFYAAGTTGERSRDKLERALALRPGYEDPKFALGSYYYFSDLVPSVLKYLRWLWFVPYGDAERGLRYLEDVHASGEINRLGATYTLFRIYALFEADRRDRALALGADLRRAFPDNAVIALDVARLLMETGRADEAAALVEEVDAKVARGIPSHDGTAAVYARIWRARSLLFTGRPTEAEGVLDAVDVDGRRAPYRAYAWKLLTRGQILDLAGRRAEAEAIYEAILDLERPARHPRVRRLAQTFLDAPFAGVERVFDREEIRADEPAAN